MEFFLKDAPVVGGTIALTHQIHQDLAKYPNWFVRAARVSRFVVQNSPEMRAQICLYEHGSRAVYVYPGLGGILQKALGHELAHAVDDIFDNPHFFTSTPEWKRIHADQPFFDIPKYREEALEYFADMVTKYFLLGPQKLRTTNPQETRFIATWVFPTLQKEFGES